MSAEKDEIISDLLCQAQSIEAKLIIFLEKLDALAVFNGNKFNQDTIKVPSVQQDSADLVTQAEDLEAQLSKSINHLSNIVALHNKSDLDWEYSESAAKGKNPLCLDTENRFQ